MLSTMRRHAPSSADDLSTSSSVARAKGLYYESIRLMRFLCCFDTFEGITPLFLVLISHSHTVFMLLPEGVYAAEGVEAEPVKNRGKGCGGRAAALPPQDKHFTM